MSLLEAFRSHLGVLRLPPGRAVVAVSGGPDSVALLDLLQRTLDVHRLDLVAAHYDHGIHPRSSAVADGVRAFVGGYAIAYEEGAGALGPGATETAARMARYAWLEALRLRLGAGLLLTAHHADDQVETVLMRILSGSGPAGLSGMGRRSGPLVRPLLPFRREIIIGYARARGLPVWSDPANTDPQHLRSWLRADLLPIIRRRLPDVDTSLLKAGRHAMRARAAWNGVLELLPGLDFQVERDGFSVAARALGAYDSTLGEAVLAAAARRVGWHLGPARAGRVLQLTSRGLSGTTVQLGQRWLAEITFDRVLVSREVTPGDRPGWTLVGGRGEARWGRWRFRWSPDAAPPRQERTGLVVWMRPASLLVRGWAAGERLRPLRGRGRRLVVRCFQDARVPRSRRGDWPVLADAAGDVVWIPGVSRSDALLPDPGTEATRIDAEYT